MKRGEWWEYEEMYFIAILIVVNYVTYRACLVDREFVSYT